MNSSFTIVLDSSTEVTLKFSGELTVYEITSYENILEQNDFSSTKKIKIDFEDVSYLDTAVSIFFHKFMEKCKTNSVEVDYLTSNKEIISTLELTKHSSTNNHTKIKFQKISFFESIGHKVYQNYLGFISFMMFLGKLFSTKLHYLKSFQNIRYKEIAFEVYENGIKALWIIALTSFLIGLVVAYQSAYQLKLYGANIFIVDMLGISILRELAPLITAIVIAGRSGSAFTAQIGAMKITQELDAMKTMGFDPYIFLVLPRIIALMISLPILIFVADMMGILGGMVVANIDLKITTELFLDRFSEVIAFKHFFIGLLKGPFFAFLIATIGIYRGLMVKDDTQSIGFNTTKSVVESIFAVIVCDAIFSIAFTNLGI